MRLKNVCQTFDALLGKYVLGGRYVTISLQYRCKTVLIAVNYYYKMIKIKIN